MFTVTVGVALLYVISQASRDLFPLPRRRDKNSGFRLRLRVSFISLVKGVGKQALCVLCVVVYFPHSQGQGLVKEKCNPHRRQYAVKGLIVCLFVMRHDDLWQT
jgi:hypothetical protein